LTVQASPEARKTDFLGLKYYEVKKDGGSMGKTSRNEFGLTMPGYQMQLQMKEWKSV
jgi:hypothetical protein